MDCTFTHVSLDGIAAVVPPRAINIEDELEYFDNNPKKLARAQKIIGYGTRHVVDPGVTSVDLCEAAAKRLMDGMSIDPASLDTLILVNQSPDYFHPSGSCMLHGRLGLAKSCATLDISLGCSGYVYALWLAHSLIASGASQKLLLLAGDTPSLHSTSQNRLTNPLFGDAGTATLLSRSTEENPAFFNLGSDGTGWHHIAYPGGGFRLPTTCDMLNTSYTDAGGNIWKMTESLIDGMEVFNFTMHEVPPGIRRVLERAGLGLDAIDFMALHQANKQILNAIGMELGLAPDSIHSGTFSRYGNQSTASVPCTLCDALQEKMPQSTMTLLLSGFGVGLSWANAVVRCHNSYNGGVALYEASGDRLVGEKLEAFWKKKFLGKDS